MSTPSEPEPESLLDLYAPVYAFARTIPPGRVVTYGQIAESLTEVSLTARQVGTAMRYAPPDVPWQRVVGAGGTLPIGKLSPERAQEQRRLLEAEGVVFADSVSPRVDMGRYRWLAPDDTGDLFASLRDEA